MNYKEKYLCDIFMISYLDKKGFELKMKEVFINGHFAGVDKLSDRAFSKLVHSLRLTKKELKKEVDRFYKHSKTVHWVLHDMFYVISDKKKVICYGPWWYALFHYLNYNLIMLNKGQDEEYNFADDSVFLTRGVEKAAEYLDVDVEVFSEKAVEQYFGKED